MFLFLGWGGLYLNAEAAASKIRECFSLADQIVQAVMTVKKLKVGRTGDDCRFGLLRQLLVRIGAKPREGKERLQRSRRGTD
jgi:hypothetical protein